MTLLDLTIFRNNCGLNRSSANVNTKDVAHATQAAEIARVFLILDHVILHFHSTSTIGLLT